MIEEFLMELRAQQTMTKTPTDCCALCQLSRVTNATPRKVIERQLERLTREMHANDEVGVSTGNGQTAVFTIISPSELVLQENLESLGFVEVFQFSRRKGYPRTGKLKLMIKDLANGKEL